MMQFTNAVPDIVSANKKTAENTSKLIESIDKLRETIEISNKETINHNVSMTALTVILFFIAMAQLMVGFAQISYQVFNGLAYDPLLAYGLSYLSALIITLFTFLIVNIFLNRQFGFSINEFVQRKYSQIKPNQ